MRIDSHQHFWLYNPAQHTWMTEEMAVLRRDFLPEDLAPLLKSVGFDGSIVVQARQMLEETDWLLALADQYDFIRGVVGWVDLRAADVRSQLRRYVGHPKFKGVRHIVHDEPDVEFMALPEFRRGIRALAEFGLTYDLLLRPTHLPVARRLVGEFPQQPFVVDHLAKPLIAEKRSSPWREELTALAKFDNVSCKLSGMVTEAPWRAWRSEDFTEYMNIVVDAFGPRRVMIGSDWPVCTLSGDYRAVMDIVIDYLQRFSKEEQEEMLGGNCARFYGV
ncbi:MAG: amidohydrolase family protein [Pirellulales bacterium]|nr:amidohydrolase family protein [Pirellulales bacterium]